MSKTRTNYIVDIIILIAFLITGVSGIVLLLIPGGRGLSQYVVLGIPRAGWVELHDWAGIGAMIGVFLHLALHWRWLVCVTSGMFRRPPSGVVEPQCPVAVEISHQETSGRTARRVL